MIRLPWNKVVVVFLYRVTAVGVFDTCNFTMVEPWYFGTLKVSYSRDYYVGRPVSGLKNIIMHFRPH